MSFQKKPKQTNIDGVWWKIVVVENFVVNDKTQVCVRNVCTGMIKSGIDPVSEFSVRSNERNCLNIL